MVATLALEYGDGVIHPLTIGSGDGVDEVLVQLHQLEQRLAVCDPPKTVTIWPRQGHPVVRSTIVAPSPKACVLVKARELPCLLHLGILTGDEVGLMEVIIDALWHHLSFGPLARECFRHPEHHPKLFAPHLP